MRVIFGLLLPAMFCSPLLSGCVESFPVVAGGENGVRNAVAASATSPRQATVALASLDGVPEAVSQRFDRAFAAEATAREITIVEPSTARYLVRGYLSAATSEAGTGTDLTYVYDIFDADDQRRVNRVTDTLTVPASGLEPWSSVDDKALTSLADRSADRLAAALAATPVAHAAPGPAATASMVEPASAATFN